MTVKMPIVSSILRSIKDKGLVNYQKYEYVELTKKQANVGKEVRRRHHILLTFLTEILKTEFMTADEDACKMEHTLNSATMYSPDVMEFIQTCPRLGDDWLQYLEEYRAHGGVPEKCQAPCKAYWAEFKKRNYITNTWSPDVPQ